MSKDKKDYWNDMGMQLLRTVIRKGDIYIPENLNVEYHIKKNGRVAIRPIIGKKYGKKKKK